MDGSERAPEGPRVRRGQPVQPRFVTGDQPGHDHARRRLHELRRDAQARPETQCSRLPCELAGRAALRHPPGWAVHRAHREAPTAAERSFDVGHAPRSSHAPLLPSRAVNVFLPDGSRLDLPEDATGHDAAAAIGLGLAKAAVAVKVGGEIRDLARSLADGDAIEIVTSKSGHDYLDVMRHSAAHVLAEAVTDAFIAGAPKFALRPRPIEDGFYYDFDLPRPLTAADFPALEAAINRIVNASTTSVPAHLHVEMTDEALAFFDVAGSSRAQDLAQVDDLGAPASLPGARYWQR